MVSSITARVAGTVYRATSRTDLARFPSATGFAYLSEDGRSGWFKWSTSNHSAAVTADSQQGIYVAPSSDTTGASGAWVRDVVLTDLNAQWFGVVSDGTTDDATAIQGAIDLAESLGPGTRIILPEKNHKISTGLRVKTGIFIDSAGHAQPSQGNGAPTAMSCRLTWDSGVTGATMVKFQSATSGYVVSHGGIRGITLNGNNVATRGLELVSCAFTEVSLTTIATVTVGFEINDNNSALSNGVRVPYYYHFCGSNALSHSSDGLRVDGDMTGHWCTSCDFGFVECEYVNGNGIHLRAVDSCNFKRVKLYFRAGATGYSIKFSESTNFPTFHASKNIFRHVFGAGDIYVGDYCKNNVIDVCTTESGSITYQSTGANQRVLHVNHMADFRFSQAWATHKFAFNHRIRVPIKNAVQYGATSATLTTLAALSAGTVWSYANAATNGLSWSDTVPDIVYTGTIKGLRLLISSVGSTTGNVVFYVRFRIVAPETAVGTFTTTDTFTITPKQNQTNVITEHLLTFTTPPACAYGSYYVLTIERLGADASDTWTNAIHLDAVDLIYLGDGPDSAGTYGPYTAFVSVDTANP